jgi:hypothetical protein
VYNISALILVNEISIIFVVDEIGIDPSVWHEFKVHTINKLHVVIVHADGVVCTIVLKDKVIVADLSDDLEVGTTGIVSFRFRISDLLSCNRQAQASKTQQKKSLHTESYE